MENQLGRPGYRKSSVTWRMDMLYRLRHLRFLPTPLALCLLDFTVTLLGQPAAYWDGDPSAGYLDLSPFSPELTRPIV
jgi:hypothetical protein